MTPPLPPSKASLVESDLISDLCGAVLLIDQNVGRCRLYGPADAARYAIEQAVRIVNDVPRRLAQEASPRVPAATPCEHHFNMWTGGRGEPMTQECGKCGHREVIPASTDATPAPMPTGGNVTVQPDATSCMNCGFEKPFKIFYRDPETQRVCAGICFDCVNAATRGQAERPAPTWQPIESAPKDEVIVTFGPDGVNIGDWWEQGAFGGTWTDERGNRIAPTHFMRCEPLPSAPRPPLGREGE